MEAVSEASLWPLGRWFESKESMGVKVDLCSCAEPFLMFWSADTVLLKNVWMYTEHVDKRSVIFFSVMPDKRVFCDLAKPHPAQTFSSLRSKWMKGSKHDYFGYIMNAQLSNLLLFCSVANSYVKILLAVIFSANLALAVMISLSQSP